MTQHGVYFAISDPSRRAILDLLSRGEMIVSDILKSFDFSQPALSKHLRILRDAGLVSQRSEGRLRWYRLEAEKLKEVSVWISHYERFWNEKLDRLSDVLDEIE